MILKLFPLHFNNIRIKHITLIEEFTRQQQTQHQEEIERQRICAVCLEEERCVLIDGCTHVSMCRMCVVELSRIELNKKCPCCRAQFKEWKVLYFP